MITKLRFGQFEGQGVYTLFNNIVSCQLQRKKLDRLPYLSEQFDFFI